MRRIQLYISMFLFACISMQMNAQITPPINQPVKTCAADKVHKQLMLSDAGYAKRMQQFENYMRTVPVNLNKTTTIIYRVPVVVNVMHKGEAVGVGTNVSDASIQNAIKFMNQMYRKEAGSAWDGNGVDVEIEYVLAVRDPNGNCTNGINRINMSGNSTYMTYGVKQQTSNGMTDAALKATYVWDQTEYYNIWLVSEIDDNEGGAGIQGYAYFASAHGQSYDGSLILSSNFTSGTSTTAAHEIGHSLNLYHTFEGDNDGTSCPSLSNGCGSDAGDCCGDIPAHVRSASDCVSGTNSCNGTSRDLFIHNYMDYSSDLCQNMLTANQKTRMISALTTTRASFLESNGNMALVPVQVAGVNFESSASILCGTGQSVTFTDKSTCVPNSLISSSSFSGITHLWTITNGTNTYTSSVQNPSITFTNTGTFNVTLAVTNAFGTTSLTKTGMVVIATAPSLPCTPTSQNAGNFAQTISNVSFNTINSSSSTITNSPFTNSVCTYNTNVTAGNSYVLSISANAGGSGAEVFEVYINYNNDADFADSGELIFSGSNPVSSSGTYTTNITIPGTATQNTLLRMRVIGETGSISATERTCGVAYLACDVEDYGVYISPAGCSAPTITGTTPSSRCGTGTLSIGATASAGTVNWYAAATGGTAIATGNSFTTPSLSSTTVYYVDATNAGCTTSSRTSVTASVTPAVAPSVAIALTGGTNPKCSGTTSTFTATPTNGGTTPSYQWKVNGTNVGTNSTTYTTSTITNGQAVTCVLTSNATCAAPTTATSSAVTMTVNPAVVPSVAIALTGGSNPKCSGTTSTFTATPTNGGTTPSYQWKVNGTNVGTNSTTYTTSTITNGQAVTCVLTSNASCAAPTTATSSAVTMTVNTTVTPAVAIALTSGTNPKCSGATSTFTATPTNGGTTPSYQWKVNGTNVGTNSTTYTTSTITNGQAVTCVLTSNATCATTSTAASSAVTMTVNTTVVPSVAIALTSGSNPKCSGTISTFTATATNGGTTPNYQWKINGSNVGTNSTTYTTSTVTNGQVVTCVLTSNATCAAPTTATSSAVTMTVNTTVVPGVAISQTGGSNPLCTGSSATFTATATNGGTTPSYQWKVNGSNVGTNSSTYTDAGLTNGETVSCVLTSNATCAAPTTATSSIITMTVNSTVSPSITIAQTSGTNPMCIGSSSTFTATATNGGSTPVYQWMVDGVNAGTNSSAFTATLNNGEAVTCLLTSNSACASTPTAASSAITMTVNSSSTPGVSIAQTAGNNPMCPGSSSTFSATPTNGGSSPDYQWMVNGTNVGTNSSVYSDAGLSNGDDIACMLTSNSSCASTPTAVSSAITMTVSTLPNVTANASPTSICSGSSSTLTCGGAMTYLWNTGESTINISVSPGATTGYTVTGTDALGCSNTANVTVTVTTCSTETVVSSVPCGLSVSSMKSSASAANITGATQYRFKFYNNSTNALVATRVQSSRTFTFNTVSGIYYGNTYKWTVAVDKGNGFGPESNNSCTVTFNPPQTSVTCGYTYSNISAYTTCPFVYSGTGYRFTFYNNTTNALVAVKTQTSNYIYFNTVPGLAYGNTYKWTVEAQYNNGSSLMYGPPSSSLCTISFSAPQATLPCGVTYIGSNAYSSASFVSGANAYRFSFYDATTNALVAVKTNTNQYVYLGQITGLIYNKTYKWTVETQYFNGSSYVFGPASSNTCTMTWGSSAIVMDGTDENNSLARLSAMPIADEQLFATIYPNPNNGQFTIDLSTDREIEISNILGEKVMSQFLSKGKTQININDQPTGIYFVKIKSGDKQQVIKIIKEN